MRAKILVCDDDAKASGSIADSLKRIPTLKKLFDVTPIGPDGLRAAVAGLEARRREARRRGHRSAAPADPTPQVKQVDEAAVIVVDYDLLRASDAGYLTGEGVAYLARCYSSCGFIIGVNQFGDNPFDLSLAPKGESYADLNVGSRQVVLPALWEGSRGGFAPWHWSEIPRALAAQRRRERELACVLDRPILPYLGFPEGEPLPREAAEFLMPEEANPASVTFRDFVRDSGNGLRKKDKPWRNCEIRIAASRIAGWLKGTVLPAQDVLVDAPHLVSRIPELLTGDPRKPGTWDRTTSTIATRLGLRRGPLTGFDFKRTDWLGRPAWFWRGLLNSDGIQELRERHPVKDVGSLVFCEDLSRFLPREQAREFVAQLPSPFTRRYVADPRRVKLRKADDARFLKTVVYQPEVRLAL